MYKRQDVGSRRNDQRICGHGAHGIGQRECHVVAGIHCKVATAKDDCCTAGERGRSGIASTNLCHDQTAGNIVAAVEGGTAKSGEYAGVCPVDVIARAAAVAAIALNAAEIWRGISIDTERRGFGRRAATGSLLYTSDAADEL